MSHTAAGTGSHPQSARLTIVAFARDVIELSLQTLLELRGNRTHVCSNKINVLDRFSVPQTCLTGFRLGSRKSPPHPSISVGKAALEWRLMFLTRAIDTAAPPHETLSPHHRRIASTYPRTATVDSYRDTREDSMRDGTMMGSHGRYSRWRDLLGYPLSVWVRTSSTT